MSWHLVSCTPHNQHFHFWFRTFAGKIALSSQKTGKRSHLVNFGYCHCFIKINIVCVIWWTITVYEYLEVGFTIHFYNYTVSHRNLPLANRFHYWRGSCSSLVRGVSSLLKTLKREREREREREMRPIMRPKRFHLQLHSLTREPAVSQTLNFHYSHWQTSQFLFQSRLREIFGFHNSFSQLHTLTRKHDFSQVFNLHYWRESCSPLVRGVSSVLKT